MMATINFLTIVGLSIIGTGIIQLLFPPKFDARLFGLRTRLTLKNSETWLYGQRIFSILLILFGAILAIAGLLNYNKDLKLISPFGFIAFLFLAKYITNQFISKKFPDIH